MGRCHLPVPGNERFRRGVAGHAASVARDGEVTADVTARLVRDRLTGKNEGMGGGSQRFRADARIAVGATAELWRGWDVELNRPVAIKRPHPHLVDDAETRARFLREAKNAAQLSHQNVVQIFDVGIDDTGPWIAMELAEGEALSEHLRRHGPSTASASAAIGVQVAAALSHAHRIPVVHRDIKPGNIIIGESGDVCLVDFGLARLADDGTLTGVGLIAGTPAYMAPEIIRGDPATPASDVYSLGVVLYELLTGAPPFTGDNALAVAMAHEREAPPPLAPMHPVPPALERLVMLSMAKDPARRPTAATLEVGLAELAGPGDVTRTIAASPPDQAETVIGMAGAIPSQRRRARPSRRALGVAAGSALVIAALGAGLATRDDNGPKRSLQSTTTPRAEATTPVDAAQGDTGTAAAAGTTQPTAPPAQTAPTETGSTTEQTPAAGRVAELIAAAVSAGVISEERAAKLAERLQNAEQAVLDGDQAGGAENLAKLARDATRGRLRQSALATDLGAAISALAVSWGIDLTGDRQGGGFGTDQGDDGDDG